MKRITRTGLMLFAGIAGTNGIEVEGIKGSLHLDSRLRLEVAEQEGLEQSEALTYRMRLGYAASLSDGVNFLVEGEGNVDLQLGEYDPWPGSQGNPGQTVIADPQNLEINRIQLGFDYETLKGTIGRQRIIRNNARFIGNVGWRQNEQTYDAISVSSQASDRLEFFYAYLDGANRIFGNRADASVQRQFELKSHIFEAQYGLSEHIRSGIYGYLLRIENSAVNSADTYGIWLQGNKHLDSDKVISWRLEIADQSDNNYSIVGTDFNLGYYHATVRLSDKSIGSLETGWEVLEGNGIKGFSTPLATLHAFNGFADAFLTTPGSGLRDLYLKATVFAANGTNVSVIYHDFSADRGTGSHGEEFDVVATRKLSDNLNLTAKAAYFNGNARPDIKRFWLQLDLKY